MASWLEEKLGFKFQDQNLLQKSLTHKSSSSDSNEQLEFLGDAVIDLIIGEELMRQFPDKDEGWLSKMRSRLVSEEGLSQAASDIELSQFLILGKGVSANQRMLSCAYEALIGAVYLDRGFSVSKELVISHFSQLIEKLSQGDEFGLDYKTALQEKVQSIHRALPTYEVISEDGPLHERQFRVRVKMSGVVIGEGIGKSKKQAEQLAARMAMLEIEKAESL